VKLAASGLAKRYPGGVEALADVSIELGDGEFVSLVGPSGCGKSTLLALLAGLAEPSAGTVTVDGAVVEGGLLGRIGYMPQRDLLMEWRTTLDNAALGLELAGIDRRRARERALDEVDRFGLRGFERRRPSALSGGMRQRAALLRTFLAGRDVLLLDEPFGALDALTRAEMQRWLAAVWERFRSTVLIVTHDVREAVFLADRIYVLSPRPGTVVAEVAVPLPRPRAPADPGVALLEAELLDRLLTTPRRESPAPPR